MTAQGCTRGTIAAFFGVGVRELLNHYSVEVRLGESNWRKARAAEVPNVRRIDSGFTYGATPPDDCPFTASELESVARRIVKFDVDGVPCDKRGVPLFSRKKVTQVMGRRGFVGTSWEDITTVSGCVRSTNQDDWDLSCVDWEKRIMAGRSLVPAAVTQLSNRELALKAVEVFKRLRLADVPGQPTLEKAAGEWFFEIVRVIFGCYDPTTRRRMIKELFLLVPKKNMKTTGGALIMLLLLIFNERPRGQAIMTAPVQDVAEIAFDAIAGAIELDADLSRVFDVRPHFKLVVDRRTDAQLSVMTFDPSVLTGQKLFAALVDELHVIAKNPKAASAIRQIRGGMLPFPEAILIFITTQSEDAPAGVFAAELTAVRDIRDGRRKGGRSVPILYEFPRSVQQSQGQSWRDPKLWSLVTPNLGRSISLDALESSMADAEAKGEAEMRSWASQHLNIEIGLALRSNAWSGAEAWGSSVVDPALTTLGELLTRCEVVEIGVDGGGMDDLLALAVTGREKATGKWLAWVHAWMHPIVLQRSKNVTSKTQLLDLNRDGQVTLVEHVGDDIAQLVEIVMRCEKSGLLDRIGLDPYGVGGILDALLAAGIGQERLVGVSQGWRLGGAIKTLERAIGEGRFVHGGQRLLTWCVGNAQVETRGNATLITKAASGAAKIDALMALLDAISLLATNPAAKSAGFQMIVLGSRGAAK